MDNNEYMAMYDVRGIQNYIFNTNTLKEIIGGSGIVADLIIDVFKKAIEKEFERNEYILDDEIYDQNNQPKDLQFFENKALKMEVLYYGGGNLVVLYRTTEEVINRINKIISMQLIKRSYSLSLACAYIHITNKDSYASDYRKLNEEMVAVKDNQPEIKMTGAFPIVATDPISGYPLSEINPVTHRKTTRESYLKLKYYIKMQENGKKHHSSMKSLEDYEGNEIELFGTSKGDENLIAIAHIDGNSFGSSIMNIIKDAKTYNDAAKRMRIIARNIKNAFDDQAINTVRNKLEEFAKEAGMENPHPIFRPIINAGDDITFVCNARIAMRCVKTFIETIHQYAIDKDITYKGKAGPFSACAGIAILHNGFPFSRGYELAEELCDSAKKRAKGHKVNNGYIESYVDFQYCYSGIVNSLEKLRESNYIANDGTNLCLRPYRIDIDHTNDAMGMFDLSLFNERMKMLKKEGGLPRSKAKELRDVYFEGEEALENVMTMFTSRASGKDLPKHINDYYLEMDSQRYATYYDALEMLDLHWEE